jgi:ATP-dependent exoDNAse (exonuclease V) alpha subunit
MTPESKSLGTILHILETAAESEGHCFLERRHLTLALGELVDLTEGQASAAIDLAAQSGHVVVRGTRVYLTHLDQAEREIAAAVRSLLARGHTHN